MDLSGTKWAIPIFVSLLSFSTNHIQVDSTCLRTRSEFTNLFESSKQFLPASMSLVDRGTHFVE